MMRPATEEDLSDLVRSTKTPLAIRGGGTRTIADCAGEVLETGGFSGISLYEPGALTLVAGAGTPLAEVEAALAAEGQRLPFEVPDLRGMLGRNGTSTLGGVVATNASGPRRVQVGACRDSLIGLRFVDGQGQVIRNGGRVMKNVTGYDLVKLLAGSHGTLGIMTEVAFKVLPAPERQATLRLDGLDASAAVAAMSAALGSPFEVSGAAHWPGRGTFLRIEGFDTSVSYRLGRLRGVLAPWGAAETLDDPTLWPAIRDVGALAGASGDIWRLSVKPGDAPALLERMGAEAVLLDWGGGLIWARVAPGSDLRARLGQINGHATRVKSMNPGDDIPSFAPEAAAVRALTAGLRAQFDPRGIFNRGLME
jgi:glycolate oxidase FAD binding subunit